MAKTRKNSGKPGKTSGRKKVEERWDYVPVNDDAPASPIDINAPRQTRARPAAPAPQAEPAASIPPVPARPRPRKVTKPVPSGDPDDPFLIRRTRTRKEPELVDQVPPAQNVETVPEATVPLFIQPSATTPSPPGSDHDGDNDNRTPTPSPPPPNQLSLSVPRPPLTVIPTVVDDEEGSQSDTSKEDQDQDGDGDRDGDGDDDDDDDDDDGEEEVNDVKGEEDDEIEDALDLLMPREPFKSGPLPLAALEELHAIYEDFQHKTIALAKKINKPPEVLFSQVGYGFPAAAGRNVSTWSVFQAWRAKHGAKKPADVSASEWPKILAVEYDEFLEQGLDGKPNTPANRRAVMEPLMRWYRSNLAETIARTKQKGQMKRLITRVLQGFLKLSKEAFELYDLHVFGYIMHLVPDKAGHTYSRSWGSTPAYEQMLLEHKPLINREIH
ncbi:hypothetical protein H0H92_014852, partial [Tricholoma furcatifolium]